MRKIQYLLTNDKGSFRVLRLRDEIVEPTNAQLIHSGAHPMLLGQAVSHALYEDAVTANQSQQS